MCDVHMVRSMLDTRTPGHEIAQPVRQIELKDYYLSGLDVTDGQIDCGLVASSHVMASLEAY
jgi:hypothetical protein